MNYYKTKYKDNKTKALNLLGNKCVKCGTTERLTFDHINRDRTNRKFIISQMLCCSWDRIEKELEKCQLLCISCHAYKSLDERGTKYKHGSLYTYIKLKCKCELCYTRMSEYNRKRYLAGVK